MAGIAKIASKNLDEVNKINSAVLIGLGTAVAGEVKTGSTFYAGSTALLTGSGTRTLDPASENVPAGYYAATTLSAVDADLAVGNIKQGVTIFGKLGTLAPGTLAEDVEGETLSAVTTDAAGGTNVRKITSIAGLSELSLALKNLTFNASSIAFAAGFACCASAGSNQMNLRLYMGGVLMQTSAFIGCAYTTATVCLRDFKALSGAQDCELKAYNASGSAADFSLYAGNASLGAAAIAVGSVKLV